MKDIWLYYCLSGYRISTAGPAIISNKKQSFFVYLCVSSDVHYFDQSKHIYEQIALNFELVDLESKIIWNNFN